MAAVARRAVDPEFLGEWLAAGFAKVAGVELTFLDCARYLHRVAGVKGVAQIAKDLGGKTDPRKLAGLANVYEFIPTVT